MSSALDYWAFDYTRYAEEILPALSLALEGKMDRLKQLIRIGKEQNLSFHSPWDWSRSTSYDDAPSVEEFFARLEENPQSSFSTDDFTWEIVERLIAFLPGHHFGEIFELGAELHLALVYAFCSAPMPGGIAHWPIFIGGGEDESIWRWRDYFERDEPWRDVWQPFYQQPPTAIAQHISIPYEDAYPRGLTPFGEASKRVILHGFLTPDETLRLQRELPLCRKPFLQLVSDESVREYLMGEWEHQISLTITDYTERKRQYYREYNLLNRSDRWEDVEVIAKERKEEKRISERLFGQELGSRLIYILRDFWSLRDAGPDAPEGKRFFHPKEPEQEEERFFLIPQEIYYEMDIAANIPRWAQAYPEEAEKMHLRHWEAVWQSEEELMRRINYAVSRQWGMLMYYQPGG